MPDPKGVLELADNSDKFPRTGSRAIVDLVPGHNCIWRRHQEIRLEARPVSVLLCASILLGLLLYFVDNCVIYQTGSGEPVSSVWENTKHDPYSEGILVSTNVVILGLAELRRIWHILRLGRRIEIFLIRNSILHVVGPHPVYRISLIISTVMLLAVLVVRRRCG